VPQGNEALLAEFTEGLRILKDSGEYQRIYEKWLGVYEPGMSSRKVLRYVAFVGVPLLLIAPLALLWSWPLRRQVSARTRELREGEQQLRASNQQFAASQHFLTSVIEQNPSSIWVSDGKGTLMRLNRACRELFGVSEAEVVGKYNILQDNLVEAQGHMPLVRDVFDKGEIARFTLDYDARDVKHIDVKVGRRRALDVVVSPIRDAQGNVTTAIVQHRDVTEQAQAERELRLSEEKFSRAFVSSPAALAMTRREDGKFIIVNASYSRIMGYQADEIVDRTVDDLNIYVNQHERAQLLHELRDTGTVRNYQLSVRGKTGSVRSLLVSMEPTIYGNEEGIISTFIDITDRIRAEDRVKHLNEVLRAVRNVNQLITHEKDLDALLRRACEILTETRGYRSAWIGLRLPDGCLRAAGESGIGEGFQDIHGYLEQGELPECCKKALDGADPQRIGREDAREP
jgi:PAS domain S-box-containing protein